MRAHVNRSPALLLALLSVLALAACARTSLVPECPEGYASQGDTCVCATDQACPTGMRCEEGVCECHDSSCCPAGHEYAEESQSCVCRDSSCCPVSHVWREDVARCECGDQECCPTGYAFDERAGACRCSSDTCCPVGFAFDPRDNRCVCASDACCPVGHVFDPVRKDCLCAKDSCCPPGHTYNPEVRACVCTSDACCPAGYKKDPRTDRCVCTGDAACGAGNFCDPESGSCRCRDNSGCTSGQYCNRFGFCQGLGSCTTNADCPSATFCDTTTDRCIPEGPCTLDEHCPFGQICDASLARCRAGCRRDADCSDKKACQGGQCIEFCRENTGCDVDQFCTASSGACGFQSGRADCRDCSSSASVCGSGASCLFFTTEGQQTLRFCGTHCSSDAQCPSGYGCVEVIYTCATEGGACPADATAPGQSFTCQRFLVENQDAAQLYCADSAHQPHVYLKACAPQSGTCPATELP